MCIFTSSNLLKKRLPGFILGPTFPHPAFVVAAVVVAVVVVVVVVGIESFSTTHKPTKNNVLPQFHQVFALISPPKTHQKQGQTENDTCFLKHLMMTGL